MKKYTISNVIIQCIKYTLNIEKKNYYYYKRYGAKN